MKNIQDRNGNGNMNNDIKNIVSSPCLGNFGRTPDNVEHLSWITVESSEDSIRLISDNGVAPYPFEVINNDQDTNKVQITYYDESDLKKWLEDVFLTSFFKKAEQEQIKSVSIPSVYEIKKWFPKKSQRCCTATEFAKQCGAATFQSQSLERCVYWLSDTGRKPGMSATVVLSNGIIYKSAFLGADNVCVRPVLEIWK